MSTDDYEGREQTLVKHIVLREYLRRFGYIVGSAWDTITYVDCFAGPWETRSSTFDDASFSIAVRQLREARDTYEAQGRHLKLRCYFLEKDKSAFAKLREFAGSVQDVEVRCQNLAFEAAVADIVQFVKEGGGTSFPFIFIDPTGWTGFGMDQIGPILRLEPAEVLINLMTGHIRRFVESPDAHTQESLKRLCGSIDFREIVAGKRALDRDDAIIEQYSRIVSETGNFRYVCPVTILDPVRNRPHFHLIFATRNPKGMEVFKGAERTAMTQMEEARGDRRRRDREEKTGQGELFPSEVMHDPSYYNELRDRYTERAQLQVLKELKRRGRLEYDIAWEVALRESLVSERDLQEWIKAWRKQGCVLVEGLRAKEKVPKRDHGQVLVYIERQTGAQT
ncbi:MAG: three-Cys-motif partner protein TcmP [Planctomycetes bacterium]|nr:three-Cys-motif partner protein TcmP [Planctomycetota bacterium]